MSATQEVAEMSQVETRNLLKNGEGDETNDEKLIERIERLERESQEKEERIEALENRTVQDLFEVRGVDEGEQPGIEHLWFSDEPLGMILDKLHKKVHKDLDGRISNIERGKVDPQDLVETATISADKLLPLHQKYLIVRDMDPSEHKLYPNQEIAARLFKFIDQYAFNDGHGKLILPSTKVRDIVEQEIYTPELGERLDVENPNDNTIKRVMKFVAEFSRDTIVLDTEPKTNRLIIDREAWLEYQQKIAEAAKNGSVHLDPNEGGD